MYLLKHFLTTKGTKNTKEKSNMWHFQNPQNYFKVLRVIPWEVRNDEESYGKKL